MYNVNMATTRRVTRTKSIARKPLSREQVLAAGLRLIDAHGFDALSMRRLGAELGVEAMALYNHVRDKDDLLDGIVELLWGEVEADTEQTADWRDGIRSLAWTLRAVVHRHSQAAPLLHSRNLMPLPILRVCDRQLQALRAGGFTQEAAAEALRTTVSFAIGLALSEVTWFGPLRPGAARESEMARLRRIAQSLPADAPDHLVEVALAVCNCDVDVQFESSLEMLVRGLDAGIGRDPSAAAGRA